MSAPDTASLAKADPLVNSGLNQLWDRAIEKYEKETNIALASTDFARKMRKQTPSEVSAVVSGYADEFGTFREHGGKAKDMLSRAVDILLSFADPAGEALSVSALLSAELHSR